MTQKKKATPIKEVYVEGNNGGSYIRLTEVSEGVVHLEVGETCVVTIDREIDVSVLAAMLTYVFDMGVNKALAAYQWPEDFIERWGDKSCADTPAPTGSETT